MSITQVSGYYNQGYIPRTYGVQSVQPTQYNTYTPDQYNTSVVTGNPILDYPISAVVDNPSVAKRLGWFLINSPSKLLSVGAGWGGIGRFFVNLIAGNVPIITSSAKAQQISNDVSRWIGKSDLLRTGADPISATLLQDVGIMNVNDLAMITNPVDQNVLHQRITMAASSRGVTPPTFGMLVSWINTAIQLPKMIK